MADDIMSSATLDAAAIAFLEKHHAAAMTTFGANGSAHSVRVAVALVDGKIWSSGTQSRVRTKHLRRDPRSTLFVFDGEWRWLTLECRVNLLEGPEAPQQNLRLFQLMQQGMTITPGNVLWYGQEVSTDDFLARMAAEHRLIYEFEVLRSYGMYAEMAAR